LGLNLTAHVSELSKERTTQTHEEVMKKYKGDKEQTVSDIF
jgi:hypothetical protein